MFRTIAVICLCLCSTSQAAALNSRSITTGGETGMVNLVEFNIRGTIHGKCSFIINDEETTVNYEEKEGVITATNDNPSLLDPVSNANKCRLLAMKKPNEAPQSRSELGEPISESSEELQKRFVEFQQQIYDNQVYMNNLKPRFIGLGLFSRLFNSGNYEFKLSSQSFGNGFNIDNINWAQGVPTTFSFGLPNKQTYPFSFGGGR